MQLIPVLFVIMSVAFAQKKVLKDERDISVTFSENGD
jgi:hypothetical protein